MVCERGGRDHHLKLTSESLSAEKRQGLMIRRLDKIVYDRRVIWRDERGYQISIARRAVAERKSAYHGR
jgi:hypothetical protein